MKKYAVLIGNTLFPNEPDKTLLPDLSCPKNDIDKLAELLGNPKIGEFAPENVTVLLNKTNSEIIEAIEDVFHNATLQDLIILYYSGHGIPVGDSPTKLFLSAHNTIFKKPVSTAVAISQLRELMDIKVSHKKIILILDCCYSGDAGKQFACKGGMDSELAKQLNENAKDIYLLAAAGSHRAWERQQYSLFTQYLIEGLETGDADLNTDGFIDIHELFNYISPRVKQEEPNQHPHFYGIAGSDGELFFAKSVKNSRAERASKIRPLLFDLATQHNDMDELVFDALKIAQMSSSELSDSQLQQDHLLTQLLNHKLSPVSFAMRWVKISSTHAHHNESKVTNNKPPKQPDNQDQYGRYLDMTINNVIQRFRWIEAGTFLMGSPESEPERCDNEKQHSVTLSQGYWLADTACTQALWQAVMGNNPSNFKGDNLPVEQVSYLDIQEFISRLNEKTGESYALPTEAQWEYACRAGTTTAFSFGDTITPEQVNYDGNYPYGNAKKGLYREKTVAVKSLPPNAWGLYEMHGNVWEWCNDWYGDYPSEPVTNPTGANKGTSRVLRGGSWINLAWDARSARRYHRAPVHRYYDGFRFALGQTAR